MLLGGRWSAPFQLQIGPLVRVQWLQDDMLALRTLNRDQTSLRLLVGFKEPKDDDPNDMVCVLP